MQVSLKLVEYILRGTSEDDRASIWLLAFSHKCVVFIADLLHLEEATVSSNIALLQFFGSVYDRGTSDTSDSVVVSLS